MIYLKIIADDCLKDFEFWSGAKDLASQLEYGEFDALEDILEDLYPDGIEDTQLNDLFWFEPKFVCELIGLEYNEETAEIIREDAE